MMGVIPMAFYALVNLFVYAVEAVLRPFVRIARAVGGARAPARGEMEMEMEKRKSGKRV